MPSLSRLNVALWVGLTATIAIGCTEPQSGLLTKTWCQPTAPSTTMLDDLEDGDAVPCATAAAHWFVDGDSTLIPTPGQDAKPVELPAGDPAWSRPVPSFRAQYLHGSLPPGGSGSLILPLADPDLTPYLEIDFWAHSDSSTLNIQVAIVSNGEIFGTEAMLTQAWGAGGSINNVALVGGVLARADGTAATDADLSAATAIAFQYQAPAGTADFGFWIDDVQLKRKP